MSESATAGETSLRDRKREETARRITLEARRLAAEVGFDQFTVDDLAAAVGVSRRTLFNYVSSKEDAVLGPVAEPSDEQLAAFRAGEPTGDLVDDLVHLLLEAARDTPVEKADMARLKAALERNPRLWQAALHRFEESAARVAADLAVREGVEVTGLRCRLAITLVAALVAEAMRTFVDARDERPFDAVMRETLDAARGLLT
jgi:AcrR family transcriptional regulator